MDVLLRLFISTSRTGREVVAKELVSLVDFLGLLQGSFLGSWISLMFIGVPDKDKVTPRMPHVLKASIFGKVKDLIGTFNVHVTLTCC
jgi:hypothetical protein